LQKSRIEGPAIGLLKVLDRPEELPDKFFLSLSSWTRNRGFPKELERKVQILIEEFLELHAFEKETLDRRVYLIGLLLENPDRSSARILRDVLRKRRFFLFGRERRKVRRAASDALRALERRGRGRCVK